jgi:hypothetical protein
MIRQVTLISAMLAAVLIGSAALSDAQASGAANAKTAQFTAQFSCSGVKIEPVSLKQSPMTVKLNLISARKVALDLGGGEIKTTVTGNDQITLHFRTKDFTGEFFHYTNDLFLIYRSGHLAKLSCALAH